MLHRNIRQMSRRSSTLSKRLCVSERFFTSDTTIMAPSATDGTVKESVIRKMTVLAQEHGAVNLSQGYPNEAPSWEVRLALAYGVLAGKPEPDLGVSEKTLRESISHLLGKPKQHKIDEVNQYCAPKGRADLREAISKHYQRIYDYSVSSDDVTVTLGATEAFASALRTIGRPGDKVVIMEPFHELYPSQCRIFYLDPIYVTLRPSTVDDTWTYDESEVEEALSQARVLVLNSPHNPTGKVFTRDELQHITDLCQKHNVWIVTDEIYEHMCYGETQHIIIPQAFPNVADQTLICNSIGKSASATGWRLGWCLHPRHLSEAYRGVHDQMVLMAPHPMQYAALTYLSIPKAYFSEDLATRYKDRLVMLAKALTEVGFIVSKPQGAYYLFANYRCVPMLKSMEPMEAAMHMVKTVGVACVPGDNFYGKAIDEGQNYLRFAACRSVEDLNEACLRLQQLK